MNVNDDEEAGRVMPTPVRVVVDWRRFACGLWRLPRGDISAAYCADRFPKLRVFTHDGRTYTNCGTLFSGAIQARSSCYPLIAPHEYAGPQKVPYSYEGKEGHYQGRAWRLGPKVIFESSDPTVAEWKRMFRILYADGGTFAQGVTFLEFLKGRLVPKSPNGCLAHEAESRQCEDRPMPATQAEMQALLAGIEDHQVSAIPRQLEFSL